MSDTEVIVTDDKAWATLKRVLPRDLYNIVKDSEQLVGEEIGNIGEGVGGSIQIWIVITRLLYEHREELRQLAKDFVEEN